MKVPYISFPRGWGRRRFVIVRCLCVHLAVESGEKVVELLVTGRETIYPAAYYHVTADDHEV